ncbi:MAG TPA: hypothetical protein V6C85_07830 [Allocoleopsis sp.]
MLADYCGITPKCTSTTDVVFPDNPTSKGSIRLSALFYTYLGSIPTTHQVDVARTFMRLSHYAPLLRLINESTVEPTGDSSMKVLIAGATGILGRRLVQQLRDRGHNAIK